jgi:hypothetical protein
MAIDSLESVQAGDTRQWIRIRGADESNPALLLIRQGPGLPMINEARRFRHVLGLEQLIRPGTSSEPSVASPPPRPRCCLACMDLARSLPRIDVPVVMVQDRHDEVSLAAGDGADGLDLAGVFQTGT